MTPLEYLHSNSDSILLVLSLPALALPLFSVPRLILSGALKRIFLKLFGGLLVIALLLGILQAALGRGSIIGGILLMGLVWLPVVGMLANAVLALVVWKSEYAQTERKAWMIGHIASALMILAYCLRSGNFIIKFLC